ncbi:Threonine/homoserine/homoserine lactone efflux protein [Thermomonospora echinospora]|uniref:Threonine/homoserine/homoserine lactone efflux protein n=1 Tax=Thermomonospora echinospora TaxID=1992 RepID=A0A1H5XH30_9ACTN|nr:LysE family translocator [Thermomonospora echinospora]SEG11134.1 Threonine/homoserine/homoserine lactone efflux protein [Thermomonospora echinospora]
MGSAQLLVFAGVVQLAVMAPGPDFAVTVRNSAVSGRRTGMMTALGIAAGIVGWSLGAALGIAALLATSATAYTVVKLVGAAYLLFLGVRAVRAALRGDYTAGTSGAGERAEPGPWTGFRQGLLCNVLNPKAAAFYVALMPQFLPPSPGPADTLVLSAIAVTLTGVWFVVVANVVVALRRMFDRPAVRRRIDAFTGIALVGLGLKLAADH